MTSPQEAVLKYASLVFAVTYVLIGIGVLWKSSELTTILNGYAIPFGIVFILYGLFRGYRVFHKYF